MTTNRKSLEKVTISDLLTFYFERSFTYPGNATGSKGLRVLKREAPLMCDTEPELVNLQRVRTLIFRLNSADLSVCEFQRGVNGVIQRRTCRLIRLSCDQLWKHFPTPVCDGLGPQAEKQFWNPPAVPGTESSSGLYFFKEQYWRYQCGFYRP